MNLEEAKETLLEHSREPLRRMRLLHSDLKGEAWNPLCGDYVHLSLRLEQERIAKIGVDSRGCTMCVASGSLLGEFIEGLELSEVPTIAARLREAILASGESPWPAELAGLEALAPLRAKKSRLNCALLPWQALAAALA